MKDLGSSPNGPTYNYMTCKTCKHWQKKYDGNDYIDPLEVHDPRLPDYDRVKSDKQFIELVGYLVKVCRNPKVKFYELPDKDGAAVVDGSGYRGILITGEDYGCNLYETNSIDSNN